MTVRDFINVVIHDVGYNPGFIVKLHIEHISIFTFDEEQNVIRLKTPKDVILPVTKQRRILIGNFITQLLNTNLDAQMYYKDIPVDDVNVENYMNTVSLILDNSNVYKTKVHEFVSDTMLKYFNKSFLNNIISNNKYKDWNEFFDIYKSK